ncbi:MAG: lipoxygenase family protein [Synechococcus sp.]
MNAGQRLTELQNEYVYNYTHIEPIAMADELPDGEGFGTDWVIQTAREALAIAINNIMVNTGANTTQEVKDEIRQVLREAAFETLREEGRAGRLKLYGNLARSVPRLLLWGFPTNESEVERFLSSAPIKGLGEQFLKPFASRVLEKLDDVTRGAENADSLSDYRDQFKYRDALPLPEIANTFLEDEIFAYMRVAGPNPLTIERMTVEQWEREKQTKRFLVSDEQFKAVMGESDSLETAIGEGRVYWLDYAILNGAINGTYGPRPEKQKYLYAPLAMFAVPVGDDPNRLLKPVAIKCGQSDEYPVITPSTGEFAWRSAKTVVQVADANFHEAVSHLARTHLLTEPFVMATHRQLPVDHPLNKLLVPHFKGTLAINNAAQERLIAPKGGVNGLLSASIDQARVLAVAGLQMRGFNDDWLRKRLEARGVDDTSKLPVYPYRDDALLIWDAIHDWVEAYITIYYATDEAVQADDRLQNWAQEVVAFDGGRLYGFGDAEDGAITSVAYLVDAVTMIIFTASAQHAAVNFPQKGIMSFVPAMPTAGYYPAEKIGPETTEEDWFKLLPPMEQAQSGINLLTLLGSVYYNRLGFYEPGYFDVEATKHLEIFQQRLEEISGEIDLRNVDRPDYDYLKPEKIPQSINI